MTASKSFRNILWMYESINTSMVKIQNLRGKEKHLYSFEWIIPPVSSGRIVVCMTLEISRNFDYTANILMFK